MRTSKRTKGTRTENATSVAKLGSVMRFNSHNFNPSAFSLVLDETLQLEETPIAYPIVHPPSSVDLPYSFEVFHDNLVSIEIGNNALANVVVNPSHEALLSARQLLEKSFGRPCVFGLEFAAQEFEFPLDLLNFGRVEKPAVRCDSKVVYSEVNAEILVATRSAGIFNRFIPVTRVTSNLSGESYVGEEFFISFNDLHSLVFPSKILLVACRNVYWNIDASSRIESCASDAAWLESEQFTVETNRTPFYDWFGFGFESLDRFQNARGLTYCFDSEIGRKLESLPDVFVNQMMQGEPVGNSFGESQVYCILNCGEKGFAEKRQFVGFDNLQLHRGNELHESLEVPPLYKLNEVVSQFPTATRLQCPLAT